MMHEVIHITGKRDEEFAPGKGQDAGSRALTDLIIKSCYHPNLDSGDSAFLFLVTKGVLMLLLAFRHTALLTGLFTTLLLGVVVHQVGSGGNAWSSTGRNSATIDK